MKGNTLRFALLGTLLVLAIVVVSKEYRNIVVVSKEYRNKDAHSQAAPPFSLPDINGKVVNLSDFQGKVLFVNFWATWCPPCREEIPSFVELYKQYKDKGFEIVGISLDNGGAEDVKPFIEKHNINYKVLIGNQKITVDYGGIVGIPTTFLIDRNGKIQKTYVGPRSKGDFEADIKALL